MTDAPPTVTTVDLSEQVAENEHVEHLLTPLPVHDGEVVVGTVALQRRAVTDYKTKQPTGEKLVEMVFQPNSGRAIRARWKHASAAVAALNAALSDEG